MIKGKEILNRPIVSLATGEKVASVHDVIFDQQGNRVLAFLVEERGLFRAAKALPFERIRSIGEDAVMIASADDIVSSRDDQRLADALASKTSLMGMTLLTTDGQNLGRIADVYFDEHNGAVVGYEATGGLFADLSSGRAFIPAPSDVQIGADAAIVPLSVAHAMKENPGGIRGAIKSVGNAVTGSVQQAQTSVREGVQSATDSVREGVQSAQNTVKQRVDEVRDATNDRQQDYVVGKVSNAEIVADDGTVVIKKGELITRLHAEVAEWHGKLPALVAAATTGTIAGAVSSATETVSGAVSGAVSEATATAKHAYEDVSAATKERQKAFVVGKTAGADILLDNGMAIVHKGDVITAAQAQAAETAGKLTALSAAVTGGELAQATQEATQQVKSRVQEGIADAKANIGASEAQHGGTPLTVEDAVGRRVKTDVRAVGGSLLAVQGQIVTPELAQRATQLGLEQPLIDATVDHPHNQPHNQPQSQPQGQLQGLLNSDILNRDITQDIGKDISQSVSHAADTASEMAATAGAALAGGVASVSEGASGLLSKAKTWLNDKRDETEAALEQREAEARAAALKDALGRPVTRVILAPNDQVILNVGDIVTNKAIQEAQASGVLDILLESVSHQG